MFPDAANETRRLILVVDDIAENRAAVCRRLEKMGYRYHAVDSGRAALAAIEAELPDLVLLDYMMPDMSGIDVLRELRQHGAYADLPVIMLTARTEREAVVGALADGANDYVTKPIDFSILQARMETHLKRQDISQQLHEANIALDRRATVRSIEVGDLQEQLAAEVRRRRAAEAALLDMEAAGRGQPAACGAIDLDGLTSRLSRLDMLATRLSTAPAGIAANPAILAEIATITRNTLDDVRRGLPRTA
jgi:DNA-binding response OmpR family regulator